MPEAPKRLGRGLATLLGQSHDQSDRQWSPDETKTGMLRSIPLDALEPNPAQPRARIDPESLAELAQSIAQQGVLQPLLVRPLAPDAARWQIIAGERRWHAARQAGLTSIPCLIQPFSDEAAALAALVENLQREDLDALEEAGGFRRLLDRFGLDHDTLAQAVGKSRSHVANTLRLLGLPSKVRAALQARTISAGHARALLAHPDPEAALATVLARGLSVRATETLAAAGKPPRVEAPAVQPTPDWSDEASEIDVLALQNSLSERLGLRVRITGGGRRGRVEIGYRSAAQLEGVLALLSPD